MKPSLLLTVLCLLPLPGECTADRSHPAAGRGTERPPRVSRQALAPGEVGEAGREEMGPTPPLDRLAPEPRPAVTGPLTLTQAEEVALRESPVLRGAVAEVDAALARLDQARAARRPSLSVNGFGSLGNSMNILPGVEPVEPRMFMIVPEGGFLDLNAMGMAPLSTGGRLRALTQRAAALRSASRADLQAMRQEVLLLTRVAYREVMARRSLTGVAEATVAATQERLRRARLLFEEGRVPRANILREEAELANAQQLLTNAGRDVEIALLQLRTVMGVAPDSPVEPGEPLIFRSAAELFTSPGGAETEGRLPGDAAELQALAQRQRPELQAAAQRARSERLGADAVRALYRPQISGMGMGDTAFTGSSPLALNVTVGVAASMSVFEGGMRRAQIREADAMRRRQEEERRKISLQVGQEVATALVTLRAAEQNVSTARAGVTAAEEDYRLALLRFEAGRSPIVEVLDAQAALTRARTNEVQALFEHNVAVDRLRRAVGTPVSVPEEPAPASPRQR